ncbi:sulfate adenylyltransferase subunit 1 [Pontibacter silvestris]|uniref:sulfate adenylyltransferase n=1 Tax=Pontibacter silvestris TaxID=2305183 RepID=A0ABW4X229_9BACT|nr:GTP-binding protein [Pontibacter silvestris]MCC9137466.1 GTP-binding protein [Pontibacter silvestris]
MDILKITTAGSVDDGKSTLIGRLLYETKSVTEDKLAAIEAASQRKGLGFLDLSLLTDGLIAEREQGITIDVAHIYFATAKRKYIIADTPGHFEYTRNMVTGASNAQVSLILIDARNGVVDQTYRHFYIASLLRIKHVIVCINKMDLVGFSEESFNQVKEQFMAYADKVRFEGQEIDFIPISSLMGENIVTPSDAMAWYDGEPLLNLLENINVEADLREYPFRMPVQMVIRPMSEQLHDYRAYAGKVASGKIKSGLAVKVLPSGLETQVQAVERFGESLTEAAQGESVNVLLTDDIDISRGDMLAAADDMPSLTKQIAATVTWLDHTSLRPGQMFLLQHGVNRVKAKVLSVTNKVDVANLTETETVDELKLNEIAQVELKLAKEIFADTYEQNKTNGAFILISEQSNNTAGVGFIKEIR